VKGVFPHRTFQIFHIVTVFEPAQGRLAHLNGVEVVIRQNYRTTFSPTVPHSTARISHGGSWWRNWEHL